MSPSQSVNMRPAMGLVTYEKWPCVSESSVIFFKVKKFLNLSAINLHKNLP